MKAKRTLDALPEDLSSVPSNHIRRSTVTCNSSFRKLDDTFYGMLTHMHMNTHTGWGCGKGGIGSF